MNRFSVFVGGTEVNDFLMTKEEAEDIRQAYENDGYDDAVIVEYTDEELENIAD